MPVVNPDALLDDRIAAIRAEHARTGITRAELDVSGGIDSAVMACLLVLALGPRNVTLLHSRMSSNSEQTKRALNLGIALDCLVANGDFGAIFEATVKELRRCLVEAGHDIAEIDARCAADPTILGSIRSTLRAPLGRGANRLTGGGLRYGTGNECEDRFLRFYQKGGDGEVDNNPLAMLSKGEVYQLAYCLTFRIPRAADVLLATINAVPSPDLWGTGDGHSDEAELLSWTGAPFTYGRINPATGEITSIGSIERVSRFLDMVVTNRADYDRPFDHTVGEQLFDDDLVDPNWNMIGQLALTTDWFSGFDRDAIVVLLKAAKWVERITRHKFNPNCPSYGDRASLVEAGILTNTFPATPDAAN
jgi:NH3-dependent NAD+ synthetase